ncbi:MAG: inositol monophosphatase [Planctomycetes bacterium]|nr:inositol monophosphatase [Planctomycetota bacterium]
MATIPLMLAFLTELAKAGGRIARDHFATVGEKDVRAKGARDWVSHVDGLVEEALVRRIRIKHPDHQILAEEAHGAADAIPAAPEEHRPLWIIDPIDGTTNFIHGIPSFAISIAFCERLRPRFALVHDPMRDETFYAEAGAGLWLNGQRRYVSSCRSLERALLGTALPFRFPGAMEPCSAVFLDVQRRCDDQRRSGSCALDMAWTAVGRLDGYYELGIYPWDTAAGELLVRSGGGVASDWHGREEGLATRRSMLCAASPELHRELQAAVAPAAHLIERAPFDRVR